MLFSRCFSLFFKKFETTQTFSGIRRSVAAAGRFLSGRSLQYDSEIQMFLHALRPEAKIHSKGSEVFRIFPAKSNRNSPTGANGTHCG